MNLRQAILSGVTDHREPKPRTAHCIALLIYGDTADQHLGTVIYRLEELERQGQVRSVVDEGSVKRWELVPAEHGSAMELGAEILIRGSFTPTDGQRQHMGFNQ